MIDLNTCQPGQPLLRCDGLKAEYLGLSASAGESFDSTTDPFRHLIKVFYANDVHYVRTYRDDGSFGRVPLNSDIIEILPMPIETAWRAKVSADHVETDSGFWAVYQGQKS